jgi:putative acetyltransferase
MSLVIRKMRPKDAQAFLEVHHRAVRSIAAKDYPSTVIDAWAPLPITEEAVEKVRSNPDGEFRLVAEVDQRVVGIGVLAVGNSELRACYVDPSVSRRGVGSALVRRIERAARQRGLGTLELDSSITAEPFYAALGYSSYGYAVHVLASGQPMGCVKMRKKL